MEWGISLKFKRRKISVNFNLVIAFTLIMIFTVLAIRISVNKYFLSSFEKYVDDSNKEEVNHLINFDISNMYIDGKWDIDYIESIGIDAIRKGIALKIYDKDKDEIWSIFTEEKVLSDTTLKRISDNMQNVDKKWNKQFKEYDIPIYDEYENMVGNANIVHYASTYYMENDMELLNTINTNILIIAMAGIISIIIISLVISRSITKPISKISKITRIIGEGNYDTKVNYKSSLKEIDELIEAINKLGNELNEQANIRKRLSADIAHELKTPITSIKGHLDIIIAGVWKPTNERLMSISEEVSRMNNLIDKLRDLAKIDSEKNYLEKEKVNLRDLLINILYNYEAEALEKNIKIDTSLENIYANIDRGKFSQVIVNLLTNAIKYNKKNGEIFISLKEEGNIVLISIKDTGIGIEKEDIKYIFDRFYREDKSRNKDTGGMGIGLTISKALIEAHGGTIDVYSVKGEGTEFIVKIQKE